MPPAMKSLPPYEFLFILSLLSLSPVSPLPSLLSLSCTSPTNKSTCSNSSKPVKLLLNIKSELTENRFEISSINSRPGWFLMHCQLRPHASTCTLCPKSAVSAWLDICYMQNQNLPILPPATVMLTNLPCFTKSNISLDRFVYGKLRDDKNKLVMTSSDSNKCRGKEGVKFIEGHCIVLFERLSAYVHADGSGSGGGQEFSSGGSVGSVGFKVKVAWAWGIVFAFVMGFVFLAWLMRRSIINRAKVAMDGDDIANKSTP